MGETRPVRLVAAPDKFRGTASASDVAAAVQRAAERCGWDFVARPLADGGEGTLDVLGGANRESLVTGPLGDAVRAGWRLDGRTAVIEMARAAGLVLAGGQEGNDAVGASTAGVGELIIHAVEAGAKRIVVTVGGSATTDGGYGAIQALQPLPRLRGIDLVVACDVRTRFVDAASVFAPQKGASPAEVKFLRRRLDRLVQMYHERYGRDIGELAGSGAAGGLAGGLAAIGARLVGGFELVAEELDLEAVLEGADVVVTGEGYVDEQSFEGKVVGGVARLAQAAGARLLVVCGDVAPEVEGRLPMVSLVARFGEERAFADTTACIEEAVTAYLSA